MAVSEPAGAAPPLFGLDTMVLIYHFESHEELGPPATELLRAAEEGRCRLVLSILAVLEVLVVPKRHGREDLCRRYREFFASFPNLEVVPVDTAIAEVASDLRAEDGLRTPDAIHLATAVGRGVDGFVTEDDRLPSEALGVSVRSVRWALSALH